MNFGTVEEVKGQVVRRVNTDYGFFWVLMKGFQKFLLPFSNYSLHNTMSLILFIQFELMK